MQALHWLVYVIVHDVPLRHVHRPDSIRFGNLACSPCEGLSSEFMEPRGRASRMGRRSAFPSECRLHDWQAAGIRAFIKDIDDDAFTPRLPCLFKMRCRDLDSVMIH